MRHFVLVLAVLAVAGCGEKAAAPAPPAGAESTPAQPAASEGAQVAMAGRDMTLYFFDRQQRTVGEERPSFSLFSPLCTLDREGVWSFKEATAVIYSRSGEETDVRAGEGVFDRENERASLTGGVTVRMGPMEAELEDMQWLNEERVAQSDNAVTIREGETDLRAATFRFHPDTQSLVLTDVTGVLALEETPES